MKKRTDFEGMLAKAKDHQESAKLYRDIGDYDSALGELDSALQILLDLFDEKLMESKETLSPENKQRLVVAEIGETYGLKGGIYRRMHDDNSAYECYFEGSIYENEKFGIESTYNQLNAIKFALLTQDIKVEELKDRVVKVLLTLTRQIDEIEGTRRMDGWAWADIGDCRTIIGDNEGAIRAYRRFMQLSGADAPKSSLSVLKMISDKLTEKNDPANEGVKSSIRFLEQAMGSH